MPANFIHGYGWGEPDTTDVSEAYDPSIAGCAGALVSDIYDLKAWVEFLYQGILLSQKQNCKAESYFELLNLTRFCFFQSAKIVPPTICPAWSIYFGSVTLI